MIPGENTKEGVAPTQEYKKLLDDIDKEASISEQTPKPQAQKPDKLDQFMNDSDGEQNFLLDELRVNKASIFLKGSRPVPEDFDADLNFDPSQIQK